LFCSQCGKQVEDSWNYCGTCGLLLVKLSRQHASSAATARLDSSNPTTKREYGDYLVSPARFQQHSLLDACMEIRVSRFAFGPVELEDWTEERLSQHLSSSTQSLFLKLLPYKLENLTIRYIDGSRKKLATWIFNQDSIQLLRGSMPLWPNDEGHRKLKWHFFQGSRPRSYLNPNLDLVLLHATQQEVSIFESRGMQCKLRPFLILHGATYTGFQEVSVEASPSGTSSVWGGRDITSYFNHPPPRWSPAFPQIRQWWKASLDEIIANQIKDSQWSWRPNTNELVENTPEEVIEAFKKQKDDPHVWYNVLGAFAEWRAVELGLDKMVTRWPVWQKCAACERFFHESSARVERLGIEQIDLCNPCLGPLFSTTHSQSREEILDYLRKLSELIERVPVNDFGSRADVLQGLTTPQRVALLSHLDKRPSLGSIKQQFGSWFAALVAAGVLPDGSRQGIFGTECLAKDGHRCLSLAEKTIDDFLTAEGVAHEKEVIYPGAPYRADFSVRGTFIEFFGLQSREDYALKTKKKIEHCQNSGICLIEIYPEDLMDTSRLRKKLSGVLSRKSGTDGTYIPLNASARKRG